MNPFVAATPIRDYDESVLWELRRLEQGTDWRWPILLSIGTAILFVVTYPESWLIALELLAIVLLHELGHLATMKAFGFRGLRLSFIPLLGGRANGRRFNVPGWKMSLVTLMGPLPGIFFGGAVGLVAIKYSNSEWMNFGFLMVLLNTFNLLPLQVVDGGISLHCLLFGRAKWSTIGFQAMSGIVFLALAVAWREWILVVFGVASVASLPMTWRLANRFDVLRRRCRLDIEGEADAIPRDVALHALQLFEDEAPNSTSPSAKQMARQIFWICHAMNGRFPAPRLALALLALHLAGLAAGIGLTLHFAAARA